jgi:hypothetical protein
MTSFSVRQAKNLTQLEAGLSDDQLLHVVG